MTRVLRTGLIVGIITICMVCACVFMAGSVFASDGLPEDVQEFYNYYGDVCYVWPDGSGECYCPCEVECEIEQVYTPTPEPTDEPVPTSVPEPTKQSKVSCNRGLGNGSEDCDPGASGGKPGSAGEDNE